MARRVTLTDRYDRLDGLRTSLSATIDGAADFRTTYRYDARLQMTRIEQTGQGGNAVAEKRIDLTYTPTGQFQSITRYADLAATQLVVASSYGYDDQQRLTSLTHAKETTTFADYSWSYDAAGRVSRFTSATDGIADYTYDARGQLLAADYDYQQDEIYSYDENGNRAGAGYATGENNRLTSDGIYQYEYDAEGNRTRRTEIATGDYVEYDWDFHNRLTAVRFKDSTDQLEKEVLYAYDLYDRLVSKEVDDDGDGVIDRGENYIYDDQHVVLVLDDSGAVTHRYLYGPAVDQILADENALGEVLWPLPDNQGTIRDAAEYDATTDTTTVVNHREYTAFGAIASESNPAASPAQAYTARIWDPDSGLYYYRARWYEAESGRFISEDPIGFKAGDADLYRYVGNSPGNFTDPSGLQPPESSFSTSPDVLESRLGELQELYPNHSQIELEEQALWEAWAAAQRKQQLHDQLFDSSWEKRESAARALGLSEAKALEYERQYRWKAGIRKFGTADGLTHPTFCSICHAPNRWSQQHLELARKVPDVAYVLVMYEAAGATAEVAGGVYTLVPSYGASSYLIVDGTSRFAGIFDPEYDVVGQTWRDVSRDLTGSEIPGMLGRETSVIIVGGASAGRSLSVGLTRSNQVSTSGLALESATGSQYTANPMMEHLGRGYGLAAEHAAIRQRVLVNIAESQAARNASNFEIHVAREQVIAIDQKIAANYQRYYTEAWQDVVDRFNAGQIRIPAGMDWRTVLGGRTDAIARARLRLFLEREGIPEGHGTGVLVNRWLVDPAGSGRYRIPDVRLDFTRRILDGTIGGKNQSSPQVQDFIRFSGGYDVRIVRPFGRP